jgi:uncharacterized phage protein (TIGR01671 family)
MRKIRFRGKCAVTGKWLYGVPVESVNGRWYMIHGATEDAINTNNAIDFYYTEIDGNTVGQFTGKHDAVGKPIYEGDNIHAMGTMILAVSWDENTASFIANAGTSHIMHECDDDDWASPEDWGSMYIVRNIHDKA